MFRLSILLTVFAVLSLNAQPDKLLMLRYPESINTDGSYYYVSCTGKLLSPTSKDGDGYIARLDADCNVIVPQYVKGLDAPKGSAIINHTMYVCDIDKLRAIDLSQGKILFSIDASKYTGFLNDAIALDDNTIIATGTDKGVLVQFNLSNRKVGLYSNDPFPGANGIVYDKPSNTIYVNSSGTKQEKGGIWEIKPGPKLAVRKILKDFGSLDGLAIYNGKLYFSDWGNDDDTGKIYKMEIGKWEPEFVNLDQKFGGPADFYIAENGLIYIPQMLRNQVTEAQLSK